MAALSSGNITLNQIIGELNKLDILEQKEFLAQLRAKRMYRKKNKPLANPAKGTKPLTLSEIDKIKHLARKSA